MEDKHYVMDTLMPGKASSDAMMATPSHKRGHESYQMPVELIMYSLTTVQFHT